MSDELYSRSRLKHLIFSIVLSPAVVYVLPDLGWGVKVLMVVIGLLIGYVTGTGIGNTSGAGSTKETQ